MALKRKPVTGMKDILPGEMEIRDYVISLIKETYRTFGFSSIETPCVEHIENLCSKQGGDNEKLIFKILKRGEKLKLAEAKEEADLVDGGLRYDLTVPLSRYYANHSNELPAPFKALQMGNVWRADRPQRGRFRQFMQCDIDILGEPSNLAEIELILATTALLGKLDFKNFTIRINDRRFLKAMAAYSGFAEEDYDNVFITLDKMDKIGLEGVAAELKENGYAEESVEKYLQLFKEITNDVAGVRVVCAFIDDIYTVANLIAGQDDIKVLKVKDYIKNPKSNGYRSYHMIVEIPVFFSKGKTPMRVELQIRTNGMDFWATLEHQLRYKKGIEDLPGYDEISAELLRSAQAVIETDNEMQRIKDKIGMFHDI